MKAFVIPLVAAALLVLGGSPSAADGTKIIKILVVPSTVYVIRSSPRLVPGYWTYQWIPQVYTSWGWIPGHYDPNGYWVEGHYVPQTIQTGYYQPVWAGGYRDP